jgi:hypothetical protein
MKTVGLGDVFSVYQTHLCGRLFPSDDTVKAEVEKWLREQEVSFYRQGLENVIVNYDSASTGLEAMWEKRILISKYMRMLFLFSLTSIHPPKKRGGGIYFLTYLSINLLKPKFI